MVSKWSELGILYADDIVKNANSPIDYHMRVAENDVQSGYGQLDGQGRLAGIGREVQDYIYEGQFKDNMFEGWGRYIDHRGVYWGFWTKGIRNGRGKWMGWNGENKEGNWQMGTFK